jgi:AcrR family transcriptional regulator
MANKESAPLRTYGGVSGDHRRSERRAQLIEAGLELLGRTGPDSALTVRGVCKRSGLASRYFYESFADRDALAIAVLDSVVDEIAATTLASIKSAEPDGETRVRIGLATVVRVIAKDPRKGRLLFSPSPGVAVLLARRAAATRRFAHLLAGQLEQFYGVARGAHLALLTEFLVGGLGQVLTAWLDGGLRLSEQRLVDYCADLFVTAGR